MCVEMNMHLLNGCMGLDLQGEVTNITSNGCSVVDYVIMSSSLFAVIVHFEVLNLASIQQ
jgi:hypothetical protein